MHTELSDFTHRTTRRSETCSLCSHAFRQIPLAIYLDWYIILYFYFFGVLWTVCGYYNFDYTTTIFGKIDDLSQSLLYITQYKFCLVTSQDSIDVATFYRIYRNPSVSMVTAVSDDCMAVVTL